MNRQRKEGSGALFANDKGGNESRPDWRGDVMIGGVEKEVAAWWKATRDGKKYLSLNIQPKRARDARPDAPPPAQPEPNNGDDVFDDRLPF